MYKRPHSRESFREDVAAIPAPSMDACSACYRSNAACWASQTLAALSLEDQTHGLKSCRARIDKCTKDEATVVLAAMGLTVSDAFRIMLTRVAREKALPFELLIPNATSIEAFREARHGGLRSFTYVEDLMADLNADD